jgi:hypothetical protein
MMDPALSQYRQNTPYLAGTIDSGATGAFYVARAARSEIWRHFAHRPFLPVIYPDIFTSKGRKTYAQFRPES